MSFLLRPPRPLAMVWSHSPRRGQTPSEPQTPRPERLPQAASQLNRVPAGDPGRPVPPSGSCMHPAAQARHTASSSRPFTHWPAPPPGHPGPTDPQPHAISSARGARATPSPHPTPVAWAGALRPRLLQPRVPLGAQRRSGRRSDLGPPRGTLFSLPGACFPAPRLDMLLPARRCHPPAAAPKAPSLGS